MKNLAHSASFESLDKIAPSKPGTKHLVSGKLAPFWPPFANCSPGSASSVEKIAQRIAALRRLSKEKSISVSATYEKGGPEIHSY
jgi:hypothetical protein